MLTKIDLCSMALLKLGEPAIQSFADDCAAAKLARTLFDPLVDTLISSHVWRFACKSFELTKTADDDFLIPAECLRVVKCDGEIRGNRIIARLNKITIVGLVRMPPEYFPGYFSSLVATRLAMEFCVPLVGDQTMFRMLTALYETELQSAKFIDSTTSPPSCINNFPLINTRF